MKRAILIEFEPGSNWQDEIQMNSLEIMINVWKIHAEAAHKKNKIVIKKAKEE